MNDSSDADLLRQFGKDNSEAAFAVLVERYLGLVHSVAFRQTNNLQHAQDISQAVFIILARKAGGLHPKTVLPGWLYHTARLTAANFKRAEWRRARREQEAFMQSDTNENSSEEVWRELSPQLESAMAQLGPDDRDALVMRYFQNRSMAEVGTELGWTENTAQKRVGRALDKLRKLFGKRGIALTGGTIATALSANAVQAAPAGLAKTITPVAVTKGATASIATAKLVKTTLKIMVWSNLTVFISLLLLHVSSAIGLCVVFVRTVAMLLKHEDMTLDQMRKSSSNLPSDRRNLNELTEKFFKQRTLVAILMLGCFLSYCAWLFWSVFDRSFSDRWERWWTLGHWAIVGAIVISVAIAWRVLGGLRGWKARTLKRNEMVVKELWESDPNPPMPAYYSNDFRTTFKRAGFVSLLELLGVLICVAAFIWMVRGTGGLKALVIFLAGFVLGIIGHYLAARRIRKGWLLTDARCIKHLVRRASTSGAGAGSGAGGDAYSCIAICEYEHSGVKYRVTPLITAMGTVSFPSAEAAELHLKKRISPDGTCKLQFNPENPLQAVLYRSDLLEERFLANRLEDSFQAPRYLAHLSGQRIPLPKFARRLFLVFFLAGFVSVLWSIVSGWQGFRSLSWPTTTGKLLECHLKESSAQIGPNYGSSQIWIVEVDYSYEVAGMNYENDRVAFGYRWGSDPSYHAAIYEKLRNASLVVVRYDPDHPATSTLAGGVGSSWLKQLVFALTWLALITGFAVLFRRSFTGNVQGIEVFLFVVGGLLLIIGVIIFAHFPGMEAHFLERIRVLK
ncbi:MAG: hypothetical protein C5B50_25960 [Verrucomicrobia bacterium]|nr:MAG: hypothetical protein C5B50_25960 [Verrucomicrobiota bacterium]